MIHGVGTDIIEIERIKRSIERHRQHFLDRVFTEKEQEYCLRHRESERHFAGRFAAKEAVVKALGTGFTRGIGWLDIEIENDSSGKPFVKLSSRLQEFFGATNLSISISHCRNYAVAFAVHEKK